MNAKCIRKKKKKHVLGIVLGRILKHKWPIRRMRIYYIAKLNASHRHASLPHRPFVDFKQIVEGGVKYEPVIVYVVGPDLERMRILGVVDV